MAQHELKTNPLLKFKLNNGFYLIKKNTYTIMSKLTSTLLYSLTGAAAIASLPSSK